jgi:hypothetical protein
MDDIENSPQSVGRLLQFSRSRQVSLVKHLHHRSLDFFTFGRRVNVVFECV